MGGDAVTRVDPHDAIDLSDAMYRTLANADFREKLRARGLKWGRRLQLAPHHRAVSHLRDDVRSGRTDPMSGV